MSGGVKDFNSLRKNIKLASPDLKKIKLAVLADFSTQFLTQALKGYGIEYGVNYQIFEADYNQIDHQIADSSSELYEFQPEYILILRSSEHLLKEFYQVETGSRESFAARKLEYYESLYDQLEAKTKSKVIYNNFFELNDSVFGNYANKIAFSFLYQVRSLNLGLMDLARKKKNLFLLDISSITAQLGYANAFDPKTYLNADMVYSLDLLPYVAQHTHSIIQSLNGQFKKCLILDLDNTLWGGIIGDDGLEGIRIGDLGIGKAFTELQLWARELKKRGIILAVCSKNTEAIAKEPFEKHPDMELSLDDIAIFVGNWENKVDNIRYIQNVLQIGFDSMVFLDDNPFEREMVKNAIPDLTVPSLPEDPAEYLVYLRSLNLFETASITEEDSVRTKQYQEEAQRSVFQKSFLNESEFLESLEMRSQVAEFTPFSIPRVAQLTQRSNQFNLRTRRYTEAEIQNVAGSASHFGYSFTLEDKFGNHGLIAVVIMEKTDPTTLFIDTWIMSCRVLKRGMENFTLNQLVKLAKENGIKRLIGEYLPTAKNGIVKEHYASLGFKEEQGRWIIDVSTYQEKAGFITPYK